MNKVFSENNFNLIRLFAAAQVAFLHGSKHLGFSQEGWFFEILEYFPGVPIFFFISGFLISKSYEKNSLLKEYSENRILRIYPALIFCTVISLISVFSLGYFDQNPVSIIELGKWFLSQITFMQFYNPEYFRGYGVGVVNGSLWTISVELQFYIFIPILYWLLGRLVEINHNRLLLLLIAIFLIFNRGYVYFAEAYDENVLYKLLGVSFIPWVYMFLVGVLAQKNFAWLHKYFADKFPYMLLIYVAASWLGVNFFQLKMGNTIGPVFFILICLLSFSAAYSFSSTSKRILGKHDISYGVYIYHMPIVNALLYAGLGGRFDTLLAAMILTFLLAIISWKLVEFPSLKFKRHPFNPLTKLS